jgi:hypothetical protein
MSVNCRLRLKWELCELIQCRVHVRPSDRGQNENGLSPLISSSLSASSSGPRREMEVHLIPSTEINLLFVCRLHFSLMSTSTKRRELCYMEKGWDYMPGSPHSSFFIQNPNQTVFREIMIPDSVSPIRSQKPRLIPEISRPLPFQIKESQSNWTLFTPSYKFKNTNFHAQL